MGVRLFPPSSRALISSGSLTGMKAFSRVSRVSVGTDAEVGVTCGVGGGNVAVGATRIGVADGVEVLVCAVEVMAVAAET